MRPTLRFTGLALVASMAWPLAGALAQPVTPPGAAPVTSPSGPAAAPAADAPPSAVPGAPARGPAAPVAPAPNGSRDAPLTTLPYTPGLDLQAMDRRADPCVDFFQYACGGWTERNPIPADQSSWSVFAKLAQDNQRYLWGVLVDLARRTGGRTASQQKIGDHFAACMDESAIARVSICS